MRVPSPGRLLSPCQRDHWFSPAGEDLVCTRARSVPRLDHLPQLRQSPQGRAPRQERTTAAERRHDARSVFIHCAGTHDDVQTYFARCPTPQFSGRQQAPKAAVDAPLELDVMRHLRYPSCACGVGASYDSRSGRATFGGLRRAPDSRHRTCQALSSRLSSSRNRQSVPCAMSFCGVFLIKPTSCRRRA